MVPDRPEPKDGELNPRDRERVPPYTIQKGATPVGLKVDYEALSGINPKQAIVDSILLAPAIGTSISTTVNEEGILINQIFGA